MKAFVADAPMIDIPDKEEVRKHLNGIQTIGFLSMGVNWTRGEAHFDDDEGTSQNIIWLTLIYNRPEDVPLNRNVPLTALPAVGHYNKAFYGEEIHANLAQAVEAAILGAGYNAVHLNEADKQK